MTGVNPHQVRGQPEAGCPPDRAPDPLASGAVRSKCCLSRPVWGGWLPQPELRKQGSLKADAGWRLRAGSLLGHRSFLPVEVTAVDVSRSHNPPSAGLTFVSGLVLSSHCPVTASSRWWPIAISNSFKEKPCHKEASGTNSSSRCCGWFQGCDQCLTPPCSPAHAGPLGPSPREAQTLVAEGLSAPCP